MGIWGALFWKEWLGLRWKLAALAAIPTALLLFELAYDRQLIPVGFIAAVMCYVAIAPIFLAMHAAAVERADGTLEFIRGLPCNRRQMGLVRVLATLGALLAPLVGTAALAYGLLLAISRWDTLPLHEFTGPEGTVKATLIGLGVATSIYLWTAALAMNESSELRAGAIGLGTVLVLCVLSLLAIVSAEQWEHTVWGSRWLGVATGLGPLGSMVALDNAILKSADRVVLVLVQVATWLLLVTVAVSRYANLEPWAWGRRKWLSDRTRALGWAQRRQGLPLGILAIATVIALSPVSDNGYLLAFFGGVWAIIVGATMFAAELEPRLYTFWRSRPIDPSNWFRVKYVAGASIALLCFDLPGAWVGHSYNQVSRFEGVIPYLICVPLLHLSVYSVAVMIVCLVRQTVYAGILSMSAMLVLVLLPTLLSMHQTAWQPLNVWWMMSSLSEAGSRAHPTSSILTSLLIYLTFHATVVVAATLAAWSSVKYDVAVRV
jgi:hypothetical protein